MESRPAIARPDAAEPSPEAEAATVATTATGSGIRAERSMKDMVISLLVLLVPIAVLFAVHKLVLNGNEPSVIDPAPVIADARSANAFPISEPTGLGSDWRVITASFRRADDGRTLRIGYVSPSGKGVQLVQSDKPAERLLPAELTRDGKPEGTVEVAGRAWQRYVARPGEHALVLLEPERTVIVIGSGAESELQQLAAALS